MPAKVLFQDSVTRVPAAWANSVSDLIYDVFGLASTKSQARKALGLGTAAEQDAANISLTGGAINGVAIGATAPSTGRFTAVTVTTLTPATSSHLTSKSYVDSKIGQSLASLSLKDMSKQASNLVSITGGVATFDTLRVRQAPSNPADVVRLDYLQGLLAQSGASQAQTPMAVASDQKTVSLGFTPTPGRVVLYVDGLYQTPDTYVISANTAIFNDVLPVNAVVGGFQL